MPAQVAAEAVVSGALADLRTVIHRGVVDLPPGAGRSTLVVRAGIADLLDAHPSTEPVHLNAPVKIPDGREANQSVLAHLEAGLVQAE